MTRHTHLPFIFAFNYLLRKKRGRRHKQNNESIYCNFYRTPTILNLTLNTRKLTINEYNICNNRRLWADAELAGGQQQQRQRQTVGQTDGQGHSPRARTPGRAPLHHTARYSVAAQATLLKPRCDFVNISNAIVRMIILA